MRYRSIHNRLNELKAEADTGAGRPVARGKGAGARGGEQISGNLYRSTSGEFQAGPAGQLKKRLEAIREARKAAKKKAKGAGKGKGAGAGKAPKKTPEQLAAEAAQATAANVAAIGAALDAADNPTMSSRGIAALIGAAAGEAPTGAMADGLIKGGFAERGGDGRFRITPEGRALLKAAEAGDEQRALDAISRAGDRASRTAEKEQNKAEREKKQAEREKKQAEREKGGGGGGRDKKKSEKERPEKAPEPEADEEPPVGFAQGGGEPPDLTDPAILDDTPAGAVLDEMTEAGRGITRQGFLSLVAVQSGDEVPDEASAALEGAGLIERASDGTPRLTRHARSAMRAIANGDKGAALEAISRAKDAVADKEEQRRATARRETERAADREQRTKERARRAADRERSKDARIQAGVETELYRIEEARKRSATKHMPGGHDQRAHGRSTPRRGDMRAAYASARAGGAPVAVARGQANNVSAIHRNQQRMANIERQLEGEISDKQRRSLGAEHERLKQNTMERVSAVMDNDLSNKLHNQILEPTVRGRYGALHDYDQRLAVSRARHGEAQNKLTEARRNLAHAEDQSQRAKGASTSIQRQYNKERAEAQREVRHWEKQEKEAARWIAKNEKLYEGELARPELRQRRADIMGERAYLQAHREGRAAEAQQARADARAKVLGGGKNPKGDASNLTGRQRVKLDDTDSATVRSFAEQERRTPGMLSKGAPKMHDDARRQYDLAALARRQGDETSARALERQGDSYTRTALSMEAASPRRARKSLDTTEIAMSDYEPLLLDITALADELAELGDEALIDGDAMKAGRMISAANMQTLEDIYDAAHSICELCEMLGVGEGEDEEDEDEDEEDAEAKAMMTEGDDATGGYLVKAQRTFGGKERDELEDSDFAGPDRTYPIMTAKDVKDAVRLVGKADDPGAVKKRIIAIARRKGLEDALPAFWGGEGKGIELLGDDLAVCPGDNVKAIAGGEGWTGGYLVRFGGEGDLSQWRDTFSPETDYGHAKTSDVWVHHRLLPGLGKKRLTNPAEIGTDDVGIFVKHLLNMRDPYERALYGMVQQNKLGWSSGAPAHLVERKALGDGRHEIVCWPMGTDASYTPCPAGGMGMDAKAMKSLFDDAGLDLLAAIYEGDDAAVKAVDQELALIAIEAELAAIAGTVG